MLKLHNRLMPPAHHTLTFHNQAIIIISTLIQRVHSRHNPQTSSKHINTQTTQKG